MANYIKKSYKSCVNCMFFNPLTKDFHHCDNNKCGIHPIYRTMCIGEAFGRVCLGWAYKKPSSEDIKKYPKLKKYVMK